MARALLVVGLFPALIAALLQVNYPLNRQLPPIAIADSPYHYQFAPTTFQTDSDTVQYSLIGGPSWLSLDSKSRTLSGTPHTSDVGEIGFTVTAAGMAGAVVSMDSKLLVSSNRGPAATGNITQILANSGQLSGSSTINIGQTQPFDITFPHDIFGSGSSLSYHALLSDHTPLPAWIGFEASTLRFSGITPPTASTQSYEILLIASERPDYGASSLSFNMTISNHRLLFEPNSWTLNLSKGEDVEIADIKSKLLLDGFPIQDTQLQSLNATLPSWLKLDKITSVIIGKAPSDVMSQDIIVRATDQFGDVAQLKIHVAFTSELFATAVGQLNATIGESFEYTIPREVLANSNEKLSVDLSSLSRYLQFDSAKSMITGTIKDDFVPQKVQCTLMALSSDGTQSDRQSFQIAVAHATADTGSVPSNSPEVNAAAPNASEDKTGGKAAGLIIGSIIGAICGILLLVVLAVCWRRRRQRYLSPKQPRSPRKSEISRPMFIPYGWPDLDVDHDQDQDLEKGKEDHDSLMERAPEKPPKLDLHLPKDHRDNESLTDSIGDADTHILDSFEASSWGINSDTTLSQHPHAMKIPTEQLKKRASLRSETFRKHKRRATTVYQDQIHRSSGLPVNRRITGMGHGRQTYSPSRSNTKFSRSSLRRRIGSSSYSTTRRTSPHSTAPFTFPQPPVSRQRVPEVTNPVQRHSIRVVAASTRSSLLDRPMDEKRESYFRNRASHKSPFFSAAGSRVSSSAYNSPPAFIEASSARNTIVRPDDDVAEGRGKELPGEATSSIPSVSPTSGTHGKEFPGSLRKNRVPRPYTSAGVCRDRVEKSYARPETTIAATSKGFGRRASTRDSLRAYELKSRLNDLTGSEIFKDAELSDSVYTDEEDEIEEAEKRVTVKPVQFTLPPLNIDTRRRSKRNSAEKQKRTSKRESQKELKRTSERDPTPFYTSYHSEHGGKENMSSTYTFGTKSTPARAQTPETKSKPKPSARHSRISSDMQKNKRASTQRPSKALSQLPSDHRHSRKSLHSRSQSRQSAPSSKKTHSRTQSTAYPYFDISTLDTSTRPSSISNAITTAADAVCRPSSSHTGLSRDLSGNLTFYADDEEPTVEELGSSSIGFRTSNGRIHPGARMSRLASLCESSHFGSPSPPPPPVSPPPKSNKRETVVRAATAAAKNAGEGVPPVQSSSPALARAPSGLGLFPVDARAEMCASVEREGTPGQGGSRATPDVESSGLEVPKGRQTWGSLRSIASTGSRWVSGGYWGKQGKEDKVFI
ncbi:hypothetical protein BDU57DRAFT_438717 [Ampelomyces quisqualis]|uniref:Dystroglycan-type cadherin-like domain-containing protein n=1 Tax=Ampelomyces quisqualis TaxID=50730 RepID=A0A6A5R1G5_AMPQU|nr:hypothetical protein BDU57DRAFT_438717 [Ampelomyces quisqualis]